MIIAEHADGAPGAFRRWMLLASVTMATTLYGMTVLIVSVVLPQMQGTLSASPDQISWVMTFNILATAVVTPLTGWLTAQFGWRQVMLNGVLGFLIATILCGQADSLESLIVYRVLQGGFGAPLVPLAQAVLLDTFPRRQHGLVTSIFGMGVVVGVQQRNLWVDQRAVFADLAPGHALAIDPVRVGRQSRIRGVVRFGFGRAFYCPVDRYAAKAHAGRPQTGA